MQCVPQVLSRITIGLMFLNFRCSFRLFSLPAPGKIFEDDANLCRARIELEED
jgi:hypothetical protein